MGRLIGLRFPPADLTTHWEDLQTLPESVLEAAIARARRSRNDFPTPYELRQDADAESGITRAALEEDRGEDLPSPIVVGALPTGTPIMQTRLWRYYHEDCGDSGTESLWCGEPNPQRKPWQGLQHCGRSAPHEAHEWVRKCTCWESNPALVKKRERQQKFAEATKGRSAA